jgi:hypothetical protein
VVTREHRLINITHSVSDFVPEVLSKWSRLSEVLLNFSRYKGNKRLTLKQNPHFYKDLPEKYEDDFQCDPIEHFLDVLGDSKGDSLDMPRSRPKIYVLTDRQGRICLESGRRSRAFGNVWCPQKAIIFKGSSLTFSTFAAFDILQMSAESSRVKRSSARPLKASLTCSIVKSLLLHRQIPWSGSHCRTGQNQSTAC